MNALVWRQSAADYFLGVATSIRSCINVTDWDAFAADSKNYYPENSILFTISW